MPSPQIALLHAHCTAVVTGVLWGVTPTFQRMLGPVSSLVNAIEIRLM